MSEPIKVTVSVRSLALLSLFSDLGLGSGEAVALSSIQQHWKTTGLRESDLLLGLQELASVGQLDLLGHEGQYRISLTALGADRSAHLQERVQHSGADIRALTVLLQTSRRHRSPRPGFGRRQMDASMPTAIATH